MMTTKNKFCGECGIEKFQDDAKRVFLDAGSIAKMVDSIENSQPFTVIFEKRDGLLRVMACQRDRDKAVILPQTSPLDSQVKVWDREKKAPRTFNLNKVVRISIP